MFCIADETNYQKQNFSCWLTFSVIYWTVQCVEDYYSEVAENLQTVSFFIIIFASKISALATLHSSLTVLVMFMIVCVMQVTAIQLWSNIVHRYRYRCCYTVFTWSSVKSCDDSVFIENVMLNLSKDYINVTCTVDWLQKFLCFFFPCIFLLHFL